MNDMMIPLPVRPKEEILSALCPMVERLVVSLRASVIPSEKDLLALQTMLQEYLSALSLVRPNREAFGEVQFANCSGEGVPDQTIAEELSRFPKAAEVLPVFAVRKLVSEADPMIAEEHTQWLIQHNYIAPVEIESAFGSGKAFALTGKGSLCFTRKKLLQKLKKSASLSAIPSGLRYFPEWWDTGSFCRAFLLQRFFACQGISDYLIFSAPKEKETLIGCEVSAAADIRYYYAWISETVSLARDQRYLRELVESPMVSDVTIICSGKNSIEEIIAFQSGLSMREKIHIYDLEAGKNEARRYDPSCPTAGRRAF